MEHSPLTTSRPSPRHHLSHLSSPRPPHHFFPSPNLEPRRRSEREELSLTTSTRTPHLATSRTSLPTSPAYRLPSLSPLSSAHVLRVRAARCASTGPLRARQRAAGGGRGGLGCSACVLYSPPPPTLHSPTAACPVPCTMFADRCLTCTLPCPVRALSSELRALSRRSLNPPPPLLFYPPPIRLTAVCPVPCAMYHVYLSIYLSIHACVLFVSVARPVVV
eukprot:scaffold53868_cov66-Phaeocystis_antarctica.AAC.4